MTTWQGRPGPEHLGEVLSALLDGELVGRAADEARAHLTTCPACSDELALVGEARSWLRSLPPVEPPSEFYERLAEEPPVDVVSLRRRRAGVAVLVTTAAASLAFIGLASPQEPATRPPVGQLVEAHATAVGTGDPVSQLVSAGVPMSFRR